MLISAHDFNSHFYLKCWRHKCKFAQKRESKQIACRNYFVEWDRERERCYGCRYGDAIATANRSKWCVRVMIFPSVSIYRIRVSSGEITSLSFAFQINKLIYFDIHTHFWNNVVNWNLLSIRARVIRLLLWIVVRLESIYNTRTDTAISFRHIYDIV